MYLVKANSLKEEGGEGIFAPIHIVLEERLDELRISSALKDVLKSSNYSWNTEFNKAIRGLYDCLNELADIQQEPIEKNFCQCQSRCPQCGRKKRILRRR